MDAKKRPTIGEFLTAEFARSNKEASRQAHAITMLGVAEAQIANAQMNLIDGDKARVARKWTRVARAAISRIEKSGKQ